MCQTVFQKFSEEKPRENKKNKKNKKNNFPEVLESRKVQNQKNLEKTKKTKKQYSRSLGEGGVRLEFQNIGFFWFFWFSRVFFGFCTFLLSKTSGKLFFLFFFGCFGFLEVFVLFPRGPPQRFSKCHS